MEAKMNEDKMAVYNILKEINNSWRTDHPEEMRTYLHPKIVMKFSEFSDKITGRKKLIESFKEFCINAQVIEYSESDEQINIIGNYAIVVYKFEMIYGKKTKKQIGRQRFLDI